MPGSERAGTKADGSSGLGSLQPGPSSGRERRKAASRHKRHRTKHSRDSPGAAAQTPLTKVKSLVEYDDISSESDTFSEVTVRSERREKEERGLGLNIHEGQWQDSIHDGEFRTDCVHKEGP
eukprot:g39268.t1